MGKKNKGNISSVIKRLIQFFYTRDKSKLKKLTQDEYFKKVVENIPEEYLEKAYDRAWEAKNYEIDNYWKRGNYFWAFQVAAFAGYFTVLGSNAYQNNPQVLYAIVGIGIVTSFAWTLTNNGSKIWQRHWEIHLYLLERKITGPMYKLVTTKKTYSVTKLNDIVSTFFIIIWIILAIKYFLDHVSFNYEGTKVDYIVILLTLSTLMFVLAMFKGHGRGRFRRRKDKPLYLRDYEVDEIRKKNKS